MKQSIDKHKKRLEINEKKLELAKLEWNKEEIQRLQNAIRQKRFVIKKLS